MKKIQNIALIALLTMIMVPQTMFCIAGEAPGMEDMIPTERQTPSETPAEKTLLERIKEARDKALEAARNRFNQAREYLRTKFTKSDQPVTGSGPESASSKSAFSGDGLGQRFSPESSGIKVDLGQDPARPVETFAGNASSGDLPVADRSNEESSGTEKDDDLTAQEHRDLAKLRSDKNSFASRIKNALFKTDYNLLKEFLQDPNTRDERLTKHEEVLKKAMARLSPQERADLLTEITVNEIAAKKYSSDDAAMIFEKNITKFNTILPKTDLIVLLHDNKSFDNTNRKGSIQSYHFGIIDMSKYDYNKTPKENFDRMKNNMSSDISLSKFEAYDPNSFDNVNPNEVPATEANAAKKQKNEETANNIFKNRDVLKSQIEAYMNNKSVRASDDVLKIVLERLPADQKAQLLTEIVREKIESSKGTNNPALEKETFNEALERINEILPNTDLLMVTHNESNSFRFQIADMKEFEYDSNASPEENAQRLAKSQKLQIQTPDLVDSMLDYYQNQDFSKYKEILTKEVMIRSNAPKLLKSEIEYILRNNPKPITPLTDNDMQKLNTKATEIAELYLEAIKIFPNKQNDITTKLIDVLTNKTFTGNIDLYTLAPKK